MGKTVSVVKCNEYEQQIVDSAVKRLIDNLGGIEKFIKKGDTVFLKANLLAPIKPEKQASTNPLVVAAVAKLVVAVGAKCIIGDSSGGPFNSTYMNVVYKTCKMTEAALASGAELNRDFTDHLVEYPKGIVAKKFPVCSAMTKADVIINIAKLKTHSFSGFSACCKNMFGAIPGLVKVQMHEHFQDIETFANALIDINEFLKPKVKLHILDAVICMEGAGPASGTPKPVGALLAGEDYSAVDSVAIKIMGDIPEVMPTLYIAKQRGLTDYSYNIVGDDYTQFISKDYKRVLPATKGALDGAPRLLRWLLDKWFTQKPSVKKNKCVGCKKCKEHCPVDAVVMKDLKKQNKKTKATSYAVFDLKKCIRCFCCQELCPFHLVKVNKPIGYKMMEKSRIRRARKQAKRESQSN
ncbi:MAG: DUF362 domain-containing protein [Firmicutes bacterium]|nr:DUF362 domain-containing protein [Bacillota bacterium]